MDDGPLLGQFGHERCRGELPRPRYGEVGHADATAESAPENQDDWRRNTKTPTAETASGRASVSVGERGSERRRLLAVAVGREVLRHRVLGTRAAGDAAVRQSDFSNGLSGRPDRRCARDPCSTMARKALRRPGNGAGRCGAG